MNCLNRLIVLSLLVGGVAACDPAPESPKGFRLPDGDPDRGRQAFVSLQCHACHEVKDVELPAPVEAGTVAYALGGEVTRVKTYGELVTSIINPSHKLATGFAKGELAPDESSPMLVYNDVMTVAQLVDLVAFLQPHYEVVVPEYDYRMYP